MTPWRLIALGASLSILTGCASASVALKPPVTLAPRLEEVKSVDEWLTKLVGAYRDNCVVLSTMRHEDAGRCDPTR